jgi:hypothetical protein
MERMTKTRKEQLQELANRFREETGSGTTTTKAFVQWLLDNKLWAPKRGSLIDDCSREIADAFRDEHVTDPQGRKVRRNYAVRIKPEGKTQQMVLWDTREHASFEHMRLSFQQRRQGIVGDCKQLHTDVESYNENYSNGREIQVCFDFTEDIAELAQPASFAGIR